MLLELFGGENELSFGNRTGAIRFVKCVDRQRAIDTCRPFALFPMEHQSTAKAANTTLPLLVQNRMRPQGGDPHGMRFFGIRIDPGNSAAEIKFFRQIEDVASTSQAQTDDDADARSKVPISERGRGHRVGSRRNRLDRTA